MSSTFQEARQKGEGRIFVLQQGYSKYLGDSKGTCQAPEHNIEPLLRAGGILESLMGNGLQCHGASTDWYLLGAAVGGRKDRLVLNTEIQAPSPLLNPYIDEFTEKQFTLLMHNWSLWENRSLTRHLICNVLLVLQERLYNCKIGQQIEYIFPLSNSFALDMFFRTMEKKTRLPHIWDFVYAPENWMGEEY